MFVPGKPFQPSVMIVRQYPTHIKHLSGAPLYGKLLVLPTNVRLSWKAHTILLHALVSYRDTKSILITTLHIMKILLTLNTGEVTYNDITFN